MSISLSTDGNFAISSHADRSLILWDLKNRGYKIISRKANIYSAYFIKDRPWFMWQNVYNNIVYIQTINGLIVKNFKANPTYGHIITNDLKNYIYVDQDWAIHVLSNSQEFLIKKGVADDGFVSNQKLLNMSLANNNKLLITAGFSFPKNDVVPINKSSFLEKQNNNSANFSYFSGINIWDITNRSIKYKLAGNIAKSIAIFSPDDKNIISIDENSVGLIWNASSGKLIYNLNKGYSKKIINEEIKTAILKYSANIAYFNIKFIDTYGNYLIFITKLPYAMLYNMNSHKKLKYIPLRTIEWPCINDYSRNLAIDSAPKAKILIIANQYSNGITVYKFNSKLKTLKHLWSMKL